MNLVFVALVKNINDVVEPYSVIAIINIDESKKIIPPIKKPIFFLDLKNLSKFFKSL